MVGQNVHQNAPISWFKYSTIIIQMEDYTQQFDLLAQRFQTQGTSGAMAEWIYKCRIKGLVNLGILIGEPYLEAFAHNFRFLTEMSVCYLATKNYERAFECAIRSTKLPITEHLARIAYSNARVCIPHIQRRYSNYPKELVYNLPNRHLNLVTFTITTCKRYDLFERTINSFLNTCQDLDLIERWICVDDNSSKEDREKMQQRYPFFEFVWKTPEQKGHAHSMNILRKSITTPFFFHMEDDWEFFVKRPYITDCLRVLEQGNHYGQCLINRNYAETHDHHDCIGGELCQVENMRYYEHSFYPNIDEFHKKFGYGSNCAYWPHYSLRPGLSRTQIYKKIGEFNPNAAHFEMDYAYRYIQNGFITTFLEHINAIHIGRLTSERDDPSKQNAYTLNNESQFVKNKKLHEHRTKLWVINLERRPDRMEQMIKILDGAKFQRYTAIDGHKICPTLDLCRLFNFNDYNYRKGMIGCALSHIDLWVRLIYDSEHTCYIVFEDDIELASNAMEKIATLIQNTEDFDILFLGHHLYNREDESFRLDREPVAERWNTIRSFSESMGGTGGYVITKGGAMGMLKFIQEHGMTNGIDTMMQHACDTLDIFYAYPHLVFSECATRENIQSVDSDIQRDYSSLRIPLERRLALELANYTPHVIIIEEDALVNYHDSDKTVFVKLASNSFTLDGKGLDWVKAHYFIDDAYVVLVPHTIDPFKLLNGGRFCTDQLIQFRE